MSASTRQASFSIHETQARCGDTVLDRHGRPFGQMHYWTDRGVSVRLFAAVKVEVGSILHDVTQVEVTSEQFAAGFYTWVRAAN